MRKLTIIALFYVGLFGSASAGSIMESSKWWPYRISVEEPYEAESVFIPSNTVGVLVRAETVDSGETHLLVDFGRKGLHRVPARLTDIETRIKRIESGMTDKPLPNYVQMLANKFALLLPEHNYKLKLKEFEEYRGFAFVYVHTLENVKTRLDEVHQMAESEKYITIVLPQSNIAGEILRRNIREHPVPAGVFFEHLVTPYQFTLSHDAGSDDLVVVTDMDGLVLESIHTANSE